MTTNRTDNHTSKMDRIVQIFADGDRRSAVLENVNKLTDAYRLKVLQAETKALKKLMAKRGSAVPLRAAKLIPSPNKDTRAEAEKYEDAIARQDATELSEKRRERLAKLFRDIKERAAVLVDVSNLTDAYRLKVLIEATEQQRKLMANRRWAVPLCTGDDPEGAA